MLSIEGCKQAVDTPGVHTYQPWLNPHGEWAGSTLLSFPTQKVKLLPFRALLFLSGREKKKKKEKLVTTTFNRKPVGESSRSNSQALWDSPSSSFQDSCHLVYSRPFPGLSKSMPRLGPCSEKNQVNQIAAWTHSQGPAKQQEAEKHPNALAKDIPPSCQACYWANNYPVIRPHV